MIQINQAANDGSSPLYIACKKGPVDVVQVLLTRKEIQINQAANGGFSPLNEASNSGHTSIVKLLLDLTLISINKTIGVLG